MFISVTWLGISGADSIWRCSGSCVILTVPGFLSLRNGPHTLRSMRPDVPPATTYERMYVFPMNSIPQNPNDFVPLGGTSRRYLNRVTGETISRRKYEKLFKSVKFRNGWYSFPAKYIDTLWARLLLLPDTYRVTVIAYGVPRIYLDEEPGWLTVIPPVIASLLKSASAGAVEQRALQMFYSVDKWSLKWQQR